MLGFLFVDEENFTIEDEAAERILTPDSAPVLKASIAAIEAVARLDVAGDRGRACAARLWMVSGSSRGPRSGRCGSR